MSDNHFLWIAEYWQSYEGGGVVGVYDSKELAMEACQRKEDKYSNSVKLTFAPSVYPKSIDYFIANGTWQYNVHKIEINRDFED